MWLSVGREVGIVFFRDLKERDYFWFGIGVGLGFREEVVFELDFEGWIGFR